jgi:apolipoprotein N-acyltransferase
LLFPANINPKRLWLLSLLSGILLWLAWPPFRFNFLMFIGFVPLLFAEDYISKHLKKQRSTVFILSWFTFLCWNVFTTYWIWFASPPGAVAAIVLNALLMTIPFTLFRRVKKKAGRTLGYFALISFWLCLEMLHLNWDAPWPWLNLGNAFATMRDWVQWYEYTGALGGTVWIWLANILIYETIGVMGQGAGVSNFRLKTGLIAVAVILIPIIISYLIKPKEIALTGKANIVAVQPNIDPYNDKFDPATYTSQINTLIGLTESKLDSNTLVVIWPETAIAESIDEDALFSYASINQIHDFLKKHPRIKLITGVNSYSVYQLYKMHSATARLFPNKTAWYDVFNAAFEMDHTDKITIYHKSKLVPGVEKMPYPRVFSFLEKLTINMGGTSGSLGSQDTPTVFKINDTLTAAPVICYESIFGGYVGKYITRGADFITIITNDGWWKNTPGYQQHLYFGALRAIETRRFIARAANTGISCFILPSGTIVQPTQYWTPDAIKSPLYINQALTFYSKNGDYLGWAGIFFGGAFFLYLVFALFLKKK